MRYVLLTFFFYGVVAVWAQVDTFLGVTVQNDFLDYRGHGTDRYYTGGHQVSLLFRKIGSRFTHHNVSLTQQLYTPDNLQDTAFRALDYPYAGLLFVSYRLQHRPTASKTSWGLSSAWGYSGKRSGAGQTQRFLHRAIGDEIPLGWNHIVENGFFAQFQLLLEQSLLTRSKVMVTFCQTIDMGTLFRRVKWGLPITVGRASMPMGSLALFQERKSNLSRFSLTTFMMPTFSRVFTNRLLQWPYHRSLGYQRALVEQLTGLEFGIQLGMGATTLHFVQYLHQAEFKQVGPHAFGEIAIMIPLSHNIQ